MAGTAARSFAPWVGRVLAAMQPQPSGSRLAGSADISVRVSTLHTSRQTHVCRGWQLAHSQHQEPTRMSTNAVAASGLAQPSGNI